ncbi:MAG: patatin-like phospholipase family protein [Cyanobacteria bacterium P01_H01_bin.58]
MSGTKHPPIPVTLNCSGGISLGAYMAGVVCELVREARSDKPLIEIDVITGASAGAITGLIAAYYLLEDTSEDLPEENEFYKIWVNKSDIATFRQKAEPNPEKDPDSQEDPAPKEQKTLLGWYKRATKDDPKRFYRSILTSSPIKNYAAQKLLADNLRIGKENPNSRLSHPLALIMTVTNLSGVLRNSGLKDKKAISYAETREFLFSSATIPKELPDMWKKAFVSAQASSAFPGAFLPVVDESDKESHNFYDCSPDYNSLFPENEQQETDTSNPENTESKIPKICKTVTEDHKKKNKFIFAYTDGGVLDNIPIIQGIKLIKHLVKCSYPKGATEKLRCEMYNFRSDWNKQSARNYRSNTVVNAHNESIEMSCKCDDSPSSNPPEAKELQFNAREEHRKYVYVQPSPHKSLNDSKDLKENFFSWLTIFWKGLKIPHLEHDHLRLEDIEIINSTYSAFEGLKTGSNNHQVDQANPYVKVNLERIDPGLLLPDDENLENLSYIVKELMGYRENLDVNSSCNQLLASDILGGFGGFFQEEYRKHDFLLGRLSALRWLEKSFSENLNETQKKRIKGNINNALNRKEDILREDPKLTAPMISRILRFTPNILLLAAVEIFQKETNWIGCIINGLTTIILIILAIIAAISYLLFSSIVWIAQQISSWIITPFQRSKH